MSRHYLLASCDERRPIWGETANIDDVDCSNCLLKAIGSADNPQRAVQAFVRFYRVIGGGAIQIVVGRIPGGGSRALDNDDSQPAPHVHEYAEIPPKGHAVDGGTVSFNTGSQWRCRHCQHRLWTSSGSTVPAPRWSSDPDGGGAVIVRIFVGLVGVLVVGVAAYGIIQTLRDRPRMWAFAAVFALVAAVGFFLIAIAATPSALRPSNGDATPASTTGLLSGCGIAAVDCLSRVSVAQATDVGAAQRAHLMRAGLLTIAGGAAAGRTASLNSTTKSRGRCLPMRHKAVGEHAAHGHLLQFNSSQSASRLAGTSLPAIAHHVASPVLAPVDVVGGEGNAHYALRMATPGAEDLRSYPGGEVSRESFTGGAV